MKTFISYSNKDSSYAQKIVNKIQKNAHSVWFAVESVTAGENYAREITQAIKSCDVLVLVFSENANGSIHIQRELDLAIKYNKKIYPLRIKNLEPNESMEYFLSTVQWYDLFVDFDRSLESFVNKVFPAESKKISITNVEDMAKKHFKDIGYEIIEYLPKYEVLKKDAFMVDNKKIQFVVVPIFIKNASVPYYKALEAELFWKYRNVIWTETFQKILKKDLNLSDGQFLSGEIDFKLKSNAVSIFRKLTYYYKKKYTNNINLLFYLYIKNPPKYKTVKYDIPLENIKSYTEDEQMKNLYLNLAFFPNWWACGKNDIDGIGRDSRYYGFLEAYKNILPMLDINENFKAKNKMYESYNGELAESLCKIFFKKCDLLVQEFGAEKSMGNALAFIDKSTEHSSDTVGNLVKLMTSPDLLVMNLNSKNSIINTFFVDVKYRVYEDDKDLLHSLEKGELLKQANKYMENWNNIYLFLFVFLKKSNSLNIFFEPVKNIIDKDGIPIQIKDKNLNYFNIKEIDKLQMLADKIWK